MLNISSLLLSLSIRNNLILKLDKTSNLINKLELLKCLNLYPNLNASLFSFFSFNSDKNLVISNKSLFWL